MAEKEYIEREATIEVLKDNVTEMESDIYYGSNMGVPKDEIEDIVNEIPAADVVEVKHGEWIFNNHQSYGEPSYFCSLCVGDRGSETGKDNYCPDCGAKMDRKGD